MYGQTDAAMEQDDRGVLSENAVQALRKTRSREQWCRYDSVVIGQGASRLSRGWFETWADFAAADRLQWFSGRDTGAGPAYTNQVTERTDWAQDLYSTRIEFLAPPGMSDLETDANDGAVSPLMFTQELPNALAFSVVLAESDEIARAPGSHFPSGYGAAYTTVADAAAPTVIGGTNGEPSISNRWAWPQPITLAAKAKLTVSASIDQPLRNVFANLPGPGTRQVPNGAGGSVELPNWYVIRISFEGPRYLQLRGARSSA